MNPFFPWLTMALLSAFSAEIMACTPKDKFPYPTDDTFFHVWSPQARRAGIVPHKQHTDDSPPPSMLSKPPFHHSTVAVRAGYNCSKSPITCDHSPARKNPLATDVRVPKDSAAAAVEPCEPFPVAALAAPALAPTTRKGEAAAARGIAEAPPFSAGKRRRARDEEKPRTPTP